MYDSESSSDDSTSTLDSVEESPEHEKCWDVDNKLDAAVANMAIGDDSIGNQMDDESNLPESAEVDDSMNISLKKELEEIAQDFKEMEILPNIVAELIKKKQLNKMILDLYDYDKGFEISFHQFVEEEEICHGRYSYGVSLIEYIRDGEIPYEIFDMFRDYDFKLYYDGYVVCQLRIHFKQEESMRSHYVLLKHTMQTIDGECSMNCEADSNLDFETERARLINHYSPDLCLDPDPAVAEIVISNELNQHPFITPYLKHVIQNEKARREKGVKEMSKTPTNSESVPTKPKDDRDWNFRLDDPTQEEAYLSALESKMRNKLSIESYLKERKICFPDKDSFNGFHVEIENFVFEYDGYTRAKKVENILDKLCIAVINDKEMYYGAYRLDARMKDFVPFYWWHIGNREDLDIYVNAITKLELKACKSTMKITHNRMFDERFEFSDGEMKINRLKLENPVSRVILHFNPPTPQDENMESDEN